MLEKMPLRESLQIGKQNRWQIQNVTENENTAIGEETDVSESSFRIQINIKYNY